MRTVITREHEISCGHRVVGHEGKCRNLHGHNYLFEFVVGAPDLDKLGRVIDFGVIKSHLCQWLEDHWDHKMLIWRDDPLIEDLQKISPESIVTVPFNPTAENIGAHLVKFVGPAVFAHLEVELLSVTVHETRKCSAIVSL